MSLIREHTAVALEEDHSRAGSLTSEQDITISDMLGVPPTQSRYTVAVSRAVNGYAGV